jgi:hypothetical protein
MISAIAECKPRVGVVLLSAWTCATTCGCQNRPSGSQSVVTGDVAPGNILIEVSSPKSTSDPYWRYRVVPAQGLVQQISAGPHSDPYTATRFDCFKGVSVPSADHIFVAECSGQSFLAHAEFTVSEVRSGHILFRWDPPGWQGVAGFLWSPNSRSVALLTYSERRGRGPMDLVWAVAGHPVPYHTFFVELIDVQRERSIKYVVRKDVYMGEGRILTWTLNDRTN